MKEKRWMKYICLFALALFLAVPAMGAKQVQAETISGSCGDAAVYEYDSSTGALTISGSGKVEKPDDDTDGWYAEIIENAAALVIGDEITAISKDTFAWFTALKSVTVGANVKTIGESAFDHCSSLTTVDMGDSAVTKIGKAAFYNCKKLKTVTFSSKLTQISYQAFYGCRKLTSVSLPTSLEKIGGMAFGYSGLTKVKIPKNVTSIGSLAFDECTSLTAITVSSSNTKYSAKSGVLYNKAKTKLIKYPEGKSASSFTVPSTVKTISSYAFSGCKLKKVTISKSVTSISSTSFAGSTALTAITVSSSNTKYSSESGVLYNKAQTKLIAYPAAKSGTSFTVPSSVKKICGYAFYYNRKLKSITVGAKVTSVGLCAFNECKKLKTVKFKGSAPTFEETDGELSYYTFLNEVDDDAPTVTVKYPASEKSSWKKIFSRFDYVKFKSYK